MTITNPENELRRLRNELDEQRRNFRSKQTSYRIALVLMFLIIIGLTAAVVHSLKLRTDIRDARRQEAQQTEKLDEQRELTETREYQLSEARTVTDSLEQQVIRLRTERDSLQYIVLRHSSPDEYQILNETEGGAYAYYRREGQFIRTDGFYQNGYELFVYQSVGEYALTDYGFFRYADLQGK